MPAARPCTPLILIGLCACNGAPAAAGSPWISQSPGWVRQPDAGVAAASNGLVAMVWIDVAPSGASGIGYAFSTDDGATFGPVTVLASPDGGVASDPTVAVDAADGFHVSWVGYHADELGDATDMHVYVASASAGAVAFGTPVELTDPADPSRYDKPWIKASGEGLVVAYQRAAAPLDVGVVMATSLDGTTWQRASVADDPSGSVFRNLAYPCASAGGGRLWVTYLTGETSFDVRLARSDDGGATWSPEIVVSAPGEPVAFDDPSCVAAAGEVWVAYGLTGDAAPFSSTVVPKLDAIRLAHSGDGGQTIDARADAHDPAAGPYFMHPQIARESGGAVDLAYYAGKSGDDPRGSFLRSRAASPASGFAPSVVVHAPVAFLQARADPRWVGDYPGIFTRGSEIYLGYAVNTSGDAHVAFARAAVP